MNDRTEQILKKFLDLRREILAKTKGDWGAADAVAYRYLNKEFHTKEFRPGMGLFFMKQLVMAKSGVIQ